MKLSVLYLATLAAPLAQAAIYRSIKGMRPVWKESFSGCDGCKPDEKEWNIALDIDTNDEAQDYTEKKSNLQLSGADTLQLIPWKSEDGDWTSARIETKDSWTPESGKKMRFQAGIRLGENLQKRGMWPAFWMMGDAIRHGTEWPLCGELDIFEQVNGDTEAWGTVHCQQPEGGPCEEPSGSRSSTSLPDNDFHDWSLIVDRTSKNWKTETISWLKDGEAFKKLTGEDVGSAETWATLAHSPYYFILNVAVGGTWPVSIYSSSVHDTSLTCNLGTP